MKRRIAGNSERWQDKSEVNRRRAWLKSVERVMYLKQERERGTKMLKSAGVSSERGRVVRTKATPIWIRRMKVCVKVPISRGVDVSAQPLRKEKEEVNARKKC